METVLSIPLPPGFRLRDAVCSYGFYMCAPNTWVDDVGSASSNSPPDAPPGASLLPGRFTRSLHVPSGATTVTRFRDLLMHHTHDGDACRRIMPALCTLRPEESEVVMIDVQQTASMAEAESSRMIVRITSKAVMDATQVDVVRLQLGRMLRLEEREVRAQKEFVKEWCRQRCRARQITATVTEDDVAALDVVVEATRTTLRDDMEFEATADEGEGGKSLPGTETACAACGALGRLFRSPTLWEDCVKTVTLCNISWPGTLRMNAALCSAFGGAFPLPRQLAQMKPEDLKNQCGVGYRAERIVRLAQAFVAGAAPPILDVTNTTSTASTPRNGSSGRRGKRRSRVPTPATAPPCPPTLAPTSSLDVSWLESPHRTEAEVYDVCMSWHGFGPYAAANLCQLLGHYGRIPADSETVRHLLECHGISTRASSSSSSSSSVSSRKGQRGGNGSPDKAKLEAALEKLYRPFGTQRFLCYWTELWEWYTRRTGLAHMAELEKERYTEFTAVTMARMGAAAVEVKGGGGGGACGGDDEKGNRVVVEQVDGGTSRKRKRS